MGGGAGEGREERRKGRRGKRSVRVRVAKGETWSVRGGGTVRVGVAMTWAPHEPG